MKLKANYKRRLFLWIVVVFAIFAAGVAALEQSREKQQKTDTLRGELDVYAHVAQAALLRDGNPGATLDSLMALFPENLRLTLIATDGSVVYDNVLQTTENHADRPEIAEARKEGAGSYIRTSATNNCEYLYYAKGFPGHYIRVALPYDIQVRQFLQPDNLFIYILLALFAVTLLLINYVAGRFGSSIGQLRDFAAAARGDGAGDLPPFDFPHDELGEVGTQIAASFHELKEKEKTIALEREKLLQHVHSSEEGICFFAPDRTVGFHNGLFLQYLNTITDESKGDPAAVFTDGAFEKIRTFLADPSRRETYFETQVARQGKYFAVRVNVFEDGSFEVTLNDITAREKTRRLKQEMTGNIAHELRTPVATIRGYLETILEQPLDAAKQRQFLEKAYNQTITLSDLIQDMGLITKIEEAPQTFALEAVPIRDLLESIKTDLEGPMRERGIRLEYVVSPNVVVRGNRSLLYSVFRNLTDNVIRYAGPDVTIHVNKYNEDSEFFYFSYADNGVGIPDEQHLGRLFERFYRINEGRTRDTGGSGLGLSIVRNAIAFHRGTIVAKNISAGGLEFLFKLPKN